MNSTKPTGWCWCRGQSQGEGDVFNGFIYPQGRIHLNEWNSGCHFDRTRHAFHRKTRTVFSSESEWLLSMWRTSQLLQAACNHGTSFQLMILMNSMEEWMCTPSQSYLLESPAPLKRDEMGPVPLLLHARGRLKEKAKALLYPPRHVPSPKLKRRSDRRTARNIDQDQPWIPWCFEMSVCLLFYPQFFRLSFGVQNSMRTDPRMLKVIFHLAHEIFEVSRVR